MSAINLTSRKTLHIDACRLRSGGGVLHLIKLLELEIHSDFEKIIVHTYENSEFKKFENEKIVIKTHPFINKNILYQIFWQRYLLKKEIQGSDLLFTIDSTSFCKVKRNVVLNQDIIGFQEGSLSYFSFKNKLVSYFKYLVAKSALKSSIANIFTTQYALDEVVKKIGPVKNPVVIPHGIDGEFLKKKEDYRIAEDTLKIIYISPILDYKNHTYLISALNNLPTKKKVCAYFVGGGDENLISKLKEQSINKKGNEFNFSGFLKREEAYKLTRSCDIAVFLSSVECFGITLLEYMRMGMPIICSSQSSLPETLQESGILVNPFDVKSITKGITDLELDQNKREQLGDKAYAISLNYSWHNTVKETYSLLGKIHSGADQNNFKPD